MAVAATAVAVHRTVLMKKIQSQKVKVAACRQRDVPVNAVKALKVRDFDYTYQYQIHVDFCIIN